MESKDYNWKEKDRKILQLLNSTLTKYAVLETTKLQSLNNSIESYIDKENHQHFIKCNQCETWTKRRYPGETFCTACGYDLKEDNNLIEAVAMDQWNKDFDAQTHIVCNKCHKDMLLEYEFCTTCGYNLRNGDIGIGYTTHGPRVHRANMNSNNI